MERLAVNSAKSRSSIPGYAQVSRRFECLVVLASLWLFTGLYLDGWAHNNIAATIDSFFTPWHAVLYSGYAATAAVLGLTYLGNLRKGYGWLRALTPEYMLSWLGAIIFAVAGNLDFIWHSIFGFEKSVEALVSPSHLILAVGGVMMMSGPLRAEWRKSAGPDARMPWRAVLSLFFVMGVFTFFTQFSNSFSHAALFVGSRPAGDTYASDVVLISYILIPTVVLMSAILMAVLHWKLPVGSLTLLLSGNALLMFVMTLSYSHQEWQVLIAAGLGGILADLLLIVLRPSAERVKQLRWFSFSVPAFLSLMYFLSLMLTKGIWWNSNMWLGMIFFSGITGLGLSWLAVPRFSHKTGVGENGSDYLPAS